MANIEKSKVVTSGSKKHLLSAHSLHTYCGKPLSGKWQFTSPMVLDNIHENCNACIRHALALMGVSCAKEERLKRERGERCAY